MPCVLVVEDDPDVREFMDLLLSTSGYQTTCAANGAEALERMRVERPCIVLLDLMMPVMDGWEFRARQLADPRIAHVPVVCVSAVYDPHEVASRLQLKCIRKPADLSEILSEVAAVCGASAPQGGTPPGAGSRR